jgi:hypothetical protein
MKKFFQYFEDLWVAVAFAEAGEYEMIRKERQQPRYEKTVRMHAS